MRIVKTAEERRNEILDAADELFAEKGFDGTSTNDILEKVGIARGTLYHHFKSKEDIMEALIKRHSDRLLSAAREIAADRSLPAVDRLIRAVMAMNLSGEREIMTHIHKPENARMHQKVQAAIINGVVPILAGIIREGMDQGLFRTPFPYESTEMILVYALAVFDDHLVQLTDEQRLSRVRAFVFNTERLLGAAEGTLMNIMQLFDSGNKDSDD